MLLDGSVRTASLAVENEKNVIIPGRYVLRICGVKLKRGTSIIRDGSAAVLG